MSTGYLTEDGYYYAPGAVLPVLVRSKCNCGCHWGVLLHITACCVPDPPPDTPRVPAVGNQERAAMRVLYGEGSWDERVKHDWPSAEQVTSVKAWMAKAGAEVVGMEITTLRWETVGGCCPLPLLVESKEQ